ncbi:MAG: NAD(P)-dependent oxidoreductase [bacterium]|nr:NAD(P)-dependent oxidoreductase [bacterium]
MDIWYGGCKIAVQDVIPYSMKIVSFEADNQTKEIFSASFTGHDVAYVDEPLNEDSVSHAEDAEVITVFVNSSVTAPVIKRLAKARLIVTLSTGYDHIDVVAAAAQGISIASVPGYGSQAVAEHTFALLLSLSRRVFDAYHQIREEGNFSIERLQGFDLAGKTLGIIGTGRIGKKVAQIANGFGMKIIAFDPKPDASLRERFGVTYIDLPELFKAADIVTVHVPLIPETLHLINDRAFALMKHGVCIVNTARGEVIDTAALLSGLKSGKVAGAALDVLEGERELREEAELITGQKKINDLKSIIRGHILIDLSNVIVTPHIAFHSREADMERISTGAEIVRAFADGKSIQTISA